MSLLKHIFLCKLLRWHNPTTITRPDYTTETWCIDCNKRLDKPKD